MKKITEEDLEALTGERERQFKQLIAKTNQESIVWAYLGQCWIWTGSTSGTPEQGRGHRYPRVSIKGVNMAARRVMYCLFYGIIPHKRQVDHICTNRKCINPNHLQLATQSKNMKLIHERKLK